MNPPSEPARERAERWAADNYGDRPSFTDVARVRMEVARRAGIAGHMAGQREAEEGIQALRDAVRAHLAAEVAIFTEDDTASASVFNALLPYRRTVLEALARLHLLNVEAVAGVEAKAVATDTIPFGVPFITFMGFTPGQWIALKANVESYAPELLPPEPAADAGEGIRP